MIVQKWRGEKALKSQTRPGYKRDICVQRRVNIKVTLEDIKRETEGITCLRCFKKSNLRRTIICIAPLSIKALSDVLFTAGCFTNYGQLARYSTLMSLMLYSVLPYLFNPDKLTLGGKLGFLFATLSLVFIVYLWFHQPQTSGRSCLGLDDIF